MKYWIATGLFCLIFTAAGVGNLLRIQPQREAIESLGYPLYLMTILGVAKLLGVVARCSCHRLFVRSNPTLVACAYGGEPAFGSHRPRSLRAATGTKNAGIVPLRAALLALAEWASAGLDDAWP